MLPMKFTFEMKLPDNNEGESEVENMKLFRGFIGGTAFVTKKGFRGSRIDSLWVQNIFDSFLKDDEELAFIACQSSIADLNDVVEGGEYGSPLSIGDYGFYTDAQLEKQNQLLSQHVRKMAGSKHYLSDAEWTDVDQKLSEIARHGKARFLKVCRGDTFASLAVRQSAFKVASKLLELGVDPLVINEENDDLMGVIKKQYQFMGDRLKEVQDVKVEANRKVLVPSVIDEMVEFETKLLELYNELIILIKDLKQNLIQRVIDIDKDKLKERKYIIMKESVPSSILWNIAQREKAQFELTECDELIKYIHQKLSNHKTHSVKFQDMSLKIFEDLIQIKNKLNENDGDSLNSSRSGYSLTSKITLPSRYSYLETSMKNKKEENGTVKSPPKEDLQVDKKKLSLSSISQLPEETSGTFLYSPLSTMSSKLIASPSVSMSQRPPRRFESSDNKNKMLIQTSKMELNHKLRKYSSQITTSSNTSFGKGNDMDNAMSLKESELEKKQAVINAIESANSKGTFLQKLNNFEKSSKSIRSEGSHHKMTNNNDNDSQISSVTGDGISQNNYHVSSSSRYGKEINSRGVSIKSNSTSQSQEGTRSRMNSQQTNRGSSGNEFILTSDSVDRHYDRTTSRSMKNGFKGKNSNLLEDEIVSKILFTKKSDTKNYSPIIGLLQESPNSTIYYR